MGIRSFFKGIVSHPSAPNLYHYKSGPNFADPGAGAFVLQHPTTLPLHSLTGRGRAVRADKWQTVNGAPVFAPLRVPTRSIGGTVAGQLVSQGLSDPNALNAAAANAGQ